MTMTAMPAHAARWLISPLTVRPGQEGRFELVAGRHRYAACVKLDLEEVEVIVRDNFALAGTSSMGAAGFEPATSRV
jgi:hypothetical protein